MTPNKVALYARVSSDQQNEAKTIESQVADLRTRIAEAGATQSAYGFVQGRRPGATGAGG